MNKKPTILPKRETTSVNKLEKFGYKLANRAHKVAILSIVSFIVFNIGWFLKQYNDYWKSRRNPNLIYDMEKLRSGDKYKFTR